MVFYTCHGCAQPLFKYEGNLDVEIICRNCRRINYSGRKDQGLGLRGKDFQAKAIDHKCFNCVRLLCRSVGDGLLTIDCRFCSKADFKCTNEYDTKLMKEGRWVPKQPLDDRAQRMKDSIAV